MFIVELIPIVEMQVFQRSKNVHTLLANKYVNLLDSVHQNDADPNQRAEATHVWLDAADACVHFEGKPIGELVLALDVLSHLDKAAALSVTSGRHFSTIFWLIEIGLYPYIDQIFFLKKTK